MNASICPHLIADTPLRGYGRSRPSKCATKLLPRLPGVKRKQPLVAMGERRLYNFSLNTKKVSKQNSRNLEQKKASDADHHPQQQQQQQSAEKVLFLWCISSASLLSQCMASLPSVCHQHFEDDALKTRVKLTNAKSS